MVAKVPGSGMGALVDEQQTGLNRATARTFGENAVAVTPEVMASAKKRIGDAFDAVEKGTTIQFDQPLISRLKAIVGRCVGCARVRSNDSAQQADKCHYRSGR